MRDTTTAVLPAIPQITEKRFCYHHQGEVAVAAGSYVVRNNRRRWICSRCQDNIAKAQRHT